MTWTAEDARRWDWLRKRVEEAEFCHLGKWGQPDWDRDIQGDVAELLAERDALVRYVEEIHRGRMILQTRDDGEAWQALPDYLRKEIENDTRI